ncbi:MAG: tetratricopeptide repeat protein [Chitinophagales bacterium]
MSNFTSTVLQKYIILILALLLLVLTFCTKKNKSQEADSPYLNQDDSVQYVGMETCKLCHADKFSTYIHTGMGLSFDLATQEKSSAVFDEHALVYDSSNDLYYKPFFENELLQILEFRLDGKDTVYQRKETVSYIIGSGQHTNSHLINFNGYIYQAPITFYTQRKQWDMAPGMENGFNSRFSRIIEFECMNCHNGLPQAVAGSVNKYEKIATGIDCERCHGPGSLHVASIGDGKLVDTATQIDYTIVNPGKLSVELQNQLCLRCHLQGVNVLNAGATFFDFKPGDKISEHWNIFLPQFDGKNDKFLMASQADRMEQSKCYIQSEKLSCITCHNPHVTVKETPIAQFNNACISCHSSATSTCTETTEVRNLAEDNCSKCHMPQSEAIDIPHVSITDHKIQIPGKEKQKEDGKFTGLKCMTCEETSPILMAKGYLTYYEAFVKEDALLDSVKKYLDKTLDKDDAYFSALIHYHYLKNDFDAILVYADKIKNKSRNAWDHYRIGEAFLQNADYKNAEASFTKAVELQPYNLDYNLKLGSAKYLNMDIDGAEKIYRFIISENPKYARAWMNLGVIIGGKGDIEEAENALWEALSLDPDYVQARLSLARLYIQTRQAQKAKEQLTNILKYSPGNKEAGALLQQLKEL